MRNISDTNLFISKDCWIKYLDFSFGKLFLEN